MAAFQNQASLTYNGSTILSNTVTGEIVADLAVTKTPVTATYRSADAPAYVITLVNSGSTSYTGLTLTDDLGTYTVSGGTVTAVPLSYRADSLVYYINGTQQTAPTVTAGPPLTVTGLDVPAGGNAMLIYRTDTNGYTPLAEGSTVVNTVTVTGASLNDPITATATVTVSSAPDLTIEKALSPSVVTENGQLTYTFTIRNSGNTPVLSTDGVTVTDTFTPILRDLRVTFNGTAWSTPTNYTYGTATGLFETVAGQITVPAATYTQDATTGQITMTPGVAVLTVSGTV